MGININCLNLGEDINNACDEVVVGEHQRTGIMLSYSEIDKVTITKDGCKVNFDLVAGGGGIKIYDPSFMPFNGTKTETESKTRLVYNQVVVIPVIERTPENAHIIDNLTKTNTRVVVLLKQEVYDEDGSNAWVLYGHETGLYVKEVKEDKANLNAYSITLRSDAVSKPDFFFFDTDLATTQAKVESFQDYYIMKVDLVEGALDITESPNTALVKLKLSNGEILSSTAGAISISAVSEERVGAALIYAQKTGYVALEVGGDAISGVISYNGDYLIISSGTTNCTGVKAESATQLSVFSDIENIDVKEAEYVEIDNDTLPSESVEKIAAALVKRGKLNGEIILTTTETLSDNCQKLLNILDSRNWTLTIP